MKWSEWLKKWKMTSLSIQAPFLDMTWEPKDADKNAAWEMYIELLTRITTQRLDGTHGDEVTALASIYSLFSTTRKIIKANGKGCIEFTKIAVVILNQRIRPFTAKWHKISIAEGFDNINTCNKFRDELSALQEVLSIYTKMLAEMASVEDLTSLEELRK